MSSYTELFTEDRRLSLLKLLGFASDYTANEYTLQAALRGHGHSVALDRLRTDLAWLAEQALIETVQVNHMHVAKLTTRGLDAAEGRALVPGVKRPLPGA